MHPSLEGHRLVARALAPLIAERSGEGLPQPVVDWLVAADPGPPVSPKLRAGLLSARALEHLAAERFDEAERCLDEVLSLGENPEARAQRAGLLAARGEGGRAWEEYQKALAEDPGNGHILNAGAGADAGSCGAAPGAGGRRSRSGCLGGPGRLIFHSGLARRVPPQWSGSSGRGATEAMGGAG